MTVSDLQNMLNNKYEIPRPELAEICFYFEDEDGNEIDLKLQGIGAFDISTDITFTFVKDESPIIMKPAGELKPNLR